MSRFIRATALAILLFGTILIPSRLLRQSLRETKLKTEEAERSLAELKESRSFSIQAVNSSHHLFGWLTPDGSLRLIDFYLIPTFDASGKITVALDARAGKSRIVGDRSMIQNVLINMGVNASHAMPNGGELSFTLEDARLDGKFCSESSLKPGEYLGISVRDTCTGMPPEVIPRGR